MITPTPRAFLEELTKLVEDGLRFSEIVESTLSLVLNGYGLNDVFTQLRPVYSSEFSDSEIRWAIAWVGIHSDSNRNFDRSPYQLSGTDRKLERKSRNPNRFRPSRKSDPASVATDYLKGFSCEESEIWKRSPVRLSESYETDAALLLSTAYKTGESIWIGSKLSDSDGNDLPTDPGTTRKRDEWLSEFGENGPLYGNSGPWVRLNPTDGNGISERNTTDFRFLLVEFDKIPLSIQFPLLARLPLPISVIIATSSNSLQSWLKVDAGSIQDYRIKSNRIFSALASYGVNPANRKSNSLGMLPGVATETAAPTDSRQRLIYLNPNPESCRIID